MLFAVFDIRRELIGYVAEEQFEEQHSSEVKIIKDDMTMEDHITLQSRKPSFHVHIT